MNLPSSGSQNVDVTDDNSQAIGVGGPVRGKILHEMIETLLCEQLREHSVAMQGRFSNENRRASSVDLVGDKCSHHVKLRMFNE